MKLLNERVVLEELKTDLAYARVIDERLARGEIKLGTEDELKKILKQKRG